jgi:hypothetical protein
MIIRGLAISVDDNVYFGLVQRISGAEPHDDNYYFMKAKAFGDAVFTAAYTTASVGSIIEAVRALESAGAAGAMALAAAPTGVGGAVLSGAAVTELAEAAAMSGISYISGKMAERSQGILKDSVEKLKETAGYIYREAKEKIENGLRDIRFTNKVEKTAEEINQFWNSKGYTNPPYKADTPVYQIELSENTSFVRVYDGVNTKINGQFVMKLEDITNADGTFLTAQQIKDKFALEHLPQYVADVHMPVGSTMNCGIAGEIPGWGKGGGLQFDLNYEFIGEFTYRATLPN